MKQPVMRRVFALVLVALLAWPALAVEPSEMLKDAALEARARIIGQELRCVVCQNQSIDDSAAEVARDMRRAVRERLTAGEQRRPGVRLHGRALRRLRAAEAALQERHLACCGWARPCCC